MVIFEITSFEYTLSVYVFFELYLTKRVVYHTPNRVRMLPSHDAFATFVLLAKFSLPLVSAPLPFFSAPLPL